MGNRKVIVWGLGLLMAAALANRLYYVFAMPFTLGEAYVFRHLTWPGAWEAMSSYASPANHVLGSVVSALLFELGLSELFAMRFAALVGGLASVLLVFRIVLSQQSARFAFFASGLWASSLGGLYYGSVGKGHALAACFALLSYLAAMRLCERQRDGRLLWSAVFVLSSALGFYSVPVFLLPFLGIGLSVFSETFHRRSGRGFLFHAGLSALALGAAALLYLPILSREGLGAITDNAFLQSRAISRLSGEDLVLFFRDTLALSDALVAGLFIPMAAVALWLSKEWKGRLMVHALLMTAVTLLYIIMSGKLPTASALVFLVPFGAMGVAEAFHNGFLREWQVYRKAMTVLMTLLPLLVLINSNREIHRTGMALAQSGAEMAELVAAEEGCAAIHAHASSPMAQFLDFYAWRMGYGYAVTVSDAEPPSGACLLVPHGEAVEGYSVLISNDFADVLKPTSPLMEDVAGDETATEEQIAL